MYIVHKKPHTTTTQKPQSNNSTILQRNVQPVTDFLNSKQSNILIQLKKDQYIPNANEPHLHIHRGGVTYTGIGHHHRDLVVGSQIRNNVINDVLLELQQLVADNNPNAQSIIDYINNEIL